MSEQILTEEELNKISKELAGQLRIDEIFLLDSFIKYHRALNSRNAKLVHENDELMAENVKLTKELKSARAMLVQSEVRRTTESGFLK